jgi:hypothetical protein
MQMVRKDGRTKHVVGIKVPIAQTAIPDGSGERALLCTSMSDIPSDRKATFFISTCG